MKVFLSYRHNSNASLIEKIKEYLSKDAMLRLYPMGIETRAELPSVIKENYYFEEI